MNITELHSDEKSISGSVAAFGAANPKVRDLENGRAIASAKRGERGFNLSGPGFKSVQKRTFWSGRNATHPNKIWRGKFQRKVRDRKNGCIDKKFYPNSAEAHREINALVNRKGKKKFRKLRAYRCSQCVGWHITHS